MLKNNQSVYKSRKYQKYKYNDKNKTGRQEKEFSKDQRERQKERKIEKTDNV